MPRQQRHKTPYPGVYYINGTAISSGKPERIYYFYYRKDGKKIEEKAGRQFQNNMTAAKAAQIRTRRIERTELSNSEKREQAQAEKKAQANRWTMERLWKDYQSGREESKGKKTDEGNFKNHLKPYIGDKTPDELNPFEIRALRKKLEKKKLSAQTIVHILGLISRAVNHGVRNQVCAPLAFKVELPKLDNQKTEDLTKEEFQRLWEAIEEDEDTQAKNFVKLILFTGMRRGELFKLRWDDLNFEREVITIRGPKGGKTQQIPMNAAAKELLLNHERIHPNDPHVFPKREGGQRTDIKRPINRIRERAKLPEGFRPLHGLRHVYASMLASSGQVDMYTLQKLLTHKSPKMTQRYAHLRDETLKRAGQTAVDVVFATLEPEKSEGAKVIDINAAKSS